jgi:hypothetical protein
MTNTTTTVDEVWAWLYQPLQDLKQNQTTDTDKPWEDHQAAFLEQLGLTNATDSPVTEMLLERLDELSADDRLALLSSDQVDTIAYEIVQQCTPTPAAEPAAYDDNAWYAFAAENLALWDGAAQSWTQFAEWFAYQGGEQGFGVPAKALVDQLTGMSNADRIVTIAQYGVTIAAPAAPADPSIRAMMEEILKEHPEFATMPEDQLLEMTAQVMAEPDEDDEDGDES